MSSALLEERRLRPVYQELENGRPKSALAELTKYIKKTPARADSPSVCALKCLVHQRLGQVEEAYDVFLRMATEGNGKSGGAGQAKIGSSASTSTSTSTSKPKVIKGKKGAKIKGGKPPQVKPQPQAQVHEEGEAPESSKQEELQAKDAVESTQSNAGKDEDKVAEKKLTERKWKDLGEDVLHTLGYALRPMRKYADLQACYAHAWSVHPENVDLGVQAFMYNLRMHRFRENQILALKLLQHTSDPKTARWAAMCGYLQTVVSSQEAADATKIDKKKQANLLDLSAKILTREPSSPYQSPEAFLLYVDLFRARGIAGVRDALVFLTPDAPVDKSSFESLPEKERDQAVKEVKDKKIIVRGWIKDLRFQWARWELVEELALNRKGQTEANKDTLVGDWDWEREWERLDDAIRGAEDVPETNYKAYLCYLTCVEVCISLKSGSDRDFIVESRETLTTLADKYGSTERAPLLAHLELVRRFNLPEEEKIDLLKTYWTRFGHKAVVVEDLRQYWPVEGETESHGIMKEVLQKDLQGEEDMNLKSYSRTLNGHKLIRYSSKPLSAEREVEAATTFSKLYVLGSRFVANLPQTDVKPGDDFAIMAAQALVRAWYLTKTRSGTASSIDGKAVEKLTTAACILQLLVDESPANGEGRFLLIKLYRLLGTPFLILPQLDALKMRTFQHDTVLHIVTERASNDFIIGGAKYQAALTKTILSRRDLYTSMEQEVGDALTNAFVEEAYSQVSDMLDLESKLTRSYQRLAGELELVRQSALRDVNELMTSLDDATSNLRGRLEDSKDVRDWDLLPDYGSKVSADEGIRQMTTMSADANSDWSQTMAKAWLSVLDPASTTDQTHSVSGPGLWNASDAERALVDFAQSLSSLRKSQPKANGNDNSASDSNAQPDADFTAIERGLSAIISSTQSDAPWQHSHSTSTLIEAVSMLEIAIHGWSKSKSKTDSKLGKNRSDLQGSGESESILNIARQVLQGRLTAIVQGEGEDKSERKKAANSRVLNHTIGLDMDVDMEDFLRKLSGFATELDQSRVNAHGELVKALNSKVTSLSG